MNSRLTCGACGHPSPAGSKFCPECGTPCAACCGSCAAELPVAAKFCAQCGSPVDATPPTPREPPQREPPQREPRVYTPKHLADKILQSKSALEGERKQVTVLFADIQGSMQLATQLDPEEWHGLLERYFAILTDAVHRFEGTVNQYTGDGIMALFGAPIAHEDHAQRACYAALQARDQLRAFADELRVTQGLNFSFRIGLNSGDVVVGKIGDDLRMDYTAQGATVGIAQRIEQLAAPGHVYLSGATERAVAGYFRLRTMGETNLKGLVEALPLFELEGTGASQTRLQVAITRGLSRFVGRGSEFQSLTAALARAQSGHGQVIGIVGEPGLGKSRLCFEFVEHCGRMGVPVFEAHCPAHGKNIPYLPILELFRNYFGVTLQDDAQASRQRIAGALVLLDPALQEVLPVLFEFMGVGDPKRPLPSMDAEAKQRQLFTMLHQVSQAHDAHGRLTVTLIDDLHWVDAGSDAFVAQLVNACAGRRSLLVLNFRPEYVATFANKPHYQQLPLVPLGDAALRELLVDLIGRDDSVTELTERIVNWTTGNPFYTEELVNALVEAGDLTGRPGHYRLVTTLQQLQVPTNVRDVLAARIDRLPEAAKRLLQTAAVIGKEFTGPLLEAVTDLAPGDRRVALERLKSGDFIHERALFPVFEYAFKHPLTHEVSYQSQLQSRRAVVHAAVARALEAQAGDMLDEQAALIAHHYELAGEVLNGARWHRRAAEWAGLNDLKAALYHWQRVRDLARQGGDEAESTALLVTACSQALAHGWRLGASTIGWPELFAEGCATAERAGDLAALARLNATYGAVRCHNQAIALDYVRYAAEAVRIAERTDDPALRCFTRAYLLIGQMWGGQLREAKCVANEVVELARKNPHLGADQGFSPVITADMCEQRYLGFTRDPLMALREMVRLRQFALDSGYPEQALWLVWMEAELRHAIGSIDALALGQVAVRLAEPLGIGNEIVAAETLCNALICERDWQLILDTAGDALRTIRQRGCMRLAEALFLAHLGTAQLALGNPEPGHAAAQKGVAIMRESKGVWNPHGYAVLAETQLALGLPVPDIAGTLDEYETLLTRTGFSIYEGEMHELRARLAEREGQEVERATALARALVCYARFGMTEQAARVKARGTGF